MFLCAYVFMALVNNQYSIFLYSMFVVPLFHSLQSGRIYEVNSVYLTILKTVIEISMFFLLAQSVHLFVTMNPNHMSRSLSNNYDFIGIQNKVISSAVLSKGFI